MADPFYGEIRMMASNFPPVDWAYCNGQSIPISQNPALYAVIGTAFGGDGVNSFLLPDFRGAAPVGAGQGPGLSSITLGEFNGVADITLNMLEMPLHTHSLNGRTGTGDQDTINPSLYLALDAGTAGTENIYYMVPGTTQPDITMAPNSLAASGSGGSHPNVQPYLTLGFCICLSGEFPSRN